MSEGDTDPELSAIHSIIAALEPLDTEARQRVVSYVFQRLRMPMENQPRRLVDPPIPSSAPESTRTETPAPIIHDVRTLKEQKSPRSANEMSAVVAYYLAELAPIEERKESIDKDDAVKFFKQAGFPLPKALRQMLPNAAKSGYFDVLGGGKYRLNPVGHNLVVHGLPPKQAGA